MPLLLPASIIFTPFCEFTYLYILYTFTRKLSIKFYWLQIKRRFLGSQSKNPPSAHLQCCNANGGHIIATKPISRVLSCAEIYLGGSSPKRSSRLNDTPAEQTITHRSNQTLHRVGFTWQRGLPRSGELLPRLSILTKQVGGIFLLHFP